MENNACHKVYTPAEIKHPWLAIASVLIGAFVGMLSETSLNIALPTPSKVFGVEASSLQWLVTGYMLIIGIVLPLLVLSLNGSLPDKLSSLP